MYGRIGVPAKNNSTHIILSVTKNLESTGIVIPTEQSDEESRKQQRTCHAGTK